MRSSLHSAVQSVPLNGLIVPGRATSLPLPVKIRQPIRPPASPAVGPKATNPRSGQSPAAVGGTAPAPISAASFDQLLTLKQVAAMLCVHPRTVRRMNERREFPRPIRTGGRLRWEQSQVMAWLKAQREGAEQ